MQIVHENSSIALKVEGSVRISDVAALLDEIARVG